MHNILYVVISAPDKMSNIKYSSVIMFLLNILLFANAYSSVIIVEDAKACYRRVLAGKRVLDRVVLRVVPCERLEDCQRECSDERRFDCETFNYRLDPSNRGKGICELTATPVAHLDLRKDFVADRDYDFYELDRNSAPDCSLTWPHWLGQGGNKRPEHRRPAWSQDRYPSQDKRWDGHGWIEYNNENRYGSNAYGGLVHRHDEDKYHHGDHLNWNGWRDRHEGHAGGRPYLPEPDRRWDRNFVPYEISGGKKDHKTWGQYGGSYGSYHSHDDHRSSYDYWGLNNYDKHYLPNNSLYPSKGVSHYDYYGDKHGYGHGQQGHGFNYFDLGHRDHGHKCCGGTKDEYWGTYGNSYGHNSHSSSYGSSHGHEIHSYGHHDYDNDGHRDWLGLQGGQYRPYDCSSRSGSGFRMSRGVIRQGFSVPDIYECERLCFSEKHFHCSSYSFRYSHSPSDNCFLSDRPYPTLDLYNDVQPDRDFDIYAMNDDRKYCEHFLEHHQSGHHYPDDRMESECFWRVRSGRRLSSGAVKIALVATGIAHCEAECLRAQSFTCRAFSFRYGPPIIGDLLENCQLTDWPHVGRSHEVLVESAPCELYERGSYGHGCEANPFALDSPNALGPAREPKKDELCFLQYDTSAKLLPEAVRVGTRLPTEHACKVHCSRLRQAAKGRSLSPDPVPFNCMSFSYTSDPHLPSHKDNCLLSDIQLRDLQPGLDYTPSKTHWLFAYNTFDPSCNGDTSRPGYGYKPGPSGPAVLPIYPPESSISSPGGYLPDRPSGPGRPIVLDGPGRPVGPSRPGGISGPSGPSSPGGPSAPGDYAGLFGRPSGHGHRHDDLGADTWSVFTVSGWPCRRGTRCAPNAIAGYWSCELEGGEIGSWDYCCHPGHRCGHSDGFNYPWCYVGPSRQQWRPCSDRYYPYAHLSSGSHESYQDSHRDKPWSDWTRPGYLPGGDRNDIPSHYQHGGRPYHQDGDRRYWQNLYKDGPQSYYDEHNNPRPGYVRVPTIEKNHIRYHHNYGPERPSRPNWVPIRAPSGPGEDSGPGFLDPPRPGGFGVARYWPVSYLHKEAPPNSTFYNSDRERNRNSIPREDFDKRRFPDSVADRRNDNVDKRPISNRKSDENNGNGGAQVLSIDSVADGLRNGRDKEANATRNTDSSLDEDKLVLVSSSNTNEDPKDKSGKIIKSSNKNEQNLGEKLDGKIVNFAEVFTVDEPFKSKLSDKEVKANLERLLKEEKQIEEIGKAFKRRDERTRNGVEKRSQENEEKFLSSFQPVFIPVDIETRSERVIDYDNSNSRRGRAYSDKPKDELESFGDSKNDAVDRNITFRDSQSFNSPKSDAKFLDKYVSAGEGGKKTFLGDDGGKSIGNSFSSIDNIGRSSQANVNFYADFNSPFGRSKSNSSLSSDDNLKSKSIEGIEYKTITSEDRKIFEADSNRSNKSNKRFSANTNENVGKSVVNNGQVFYEVLPDANDDKRQMAHIERVELKNYGVNINVNHERRKTYDKPELTEIPLVLPPQKNEPFSHKTTVRSEIDSYNDGFRRVESDSGESELHDGQFGARTGSVKKVEIPFSRNNTTGLRLIKRGRRNFRISYDPSVVRRRLLERQKMLSSETSSES